MFRRSAQPKQKVTSGRFEIEQDGHTAFLEYNLAGNILQLIHTEVPPALEGKRIASELAKSALDWAREHGAKVDVLCSFVAEYLEKHPEYADLVVR
jgi:uncharacterized protein